MINVDVRRTCLCFCSDLTPNLLSPSWQRWRLRYLPIIRPTGPGCPVTTKPTRLQSKWVRRIAAVAFAAAMMSTAFFGLRTYGSFVLLRSAYEAGAPMTSSIRAWMTLQYIATTFRTSNAALIERLGLPAGTDPNASLKSLGEQAGVAPSAYAKRVQRAIADLAPGAPSDIENGNSSWFGTIDDEVLTALLVYGYPVLGLILFLGALGFPLPDGVATTVAGSLASQGRLDWFWAAAITVAASELGDAAGYGLGRFLSQRILVRYGRWVGYTPQRRSHVQSLFDQWGSLTVFITRTFLSYLSSVASLLAGITRYRLSKFLAIALVGRLIWTAAYLGLGYGIGSDWQAATGFLTNLSVLVLSMMVLLVAGAVAAGKFTSSLGR
jgi:membrane protein DedA with SNARE-associated domain